MSDMSGDGTIEMDHASRSSAASTDKSTASPTPSSHASGSAPGSAPDDYVMVELVSLKLAALKCFFIARYCRSQGSDKLEVLLSHGRGLTDTSYA